jgi:hypothetical protein
VCNSDRIMRTCRSNSLVRVAFEESMSSYPSCLQDGRFLLEFFICHPSDLRVNAVNQCYWLQYHNLGKLQSPLSLKETHLIKPSDTSVDYAQRHKLRPFCKWINLTHLDRYVHSRTIQICLRPWSENPRSCLSGQLGRSQVTS